MNRRKDATPDALILEAYKATDGNCAEMGRRLGLDRQNVRKRVIQLGLSVKPRGGARPMKTWGGVSVLTREQLEKALVTDDWKLTIVAQKIGYSRKWLQTRMSEWGLKKPEVPPVPTLEPIENDHPWVQKATIAVDKAKRRDGES